MKNSGNVFFNGKVYLIGGWDEKDTLNKIFCFDPATEQTDFVGNLPRSVEGHSLALIDEYVFIIGGFDNLGVTDRIMRINLKTLRSDVIPCTLHQKRENHTC
jgi:hypothetical protein